MPTLVTEVLGSIFLYSLFIFKLSCYFPSLILLYHQWLALSRKPPGAKDRAGEGTTREGDDGRGSRLVPRYVFFFFLSIPLFSTKCQCLPAFRTSKMTMNSHHHHHQHRNEHMSLRHMSHLQLKPEVCFFFLNYSTNVLNGLCIIRLWMTTNDSHCHHTVTPGWRMGGWGGTRHSRHWVCFFF